jgi:hypothetical protein
MLALISKLAACGPFMTPSPPTEDDPLEEAAASIAQDDATPTAPATGVPTTPTTDAPAAPTTDAPAAPTTDAPAAPTPTPPPVDADTLIRATSDCTLRPAAFFVAWNGVLTLVYTGFPPSLERLKSALNKEPLGLPLENFGSKVRRGVARS